jgi:hypothetical protein
MDIEPLLQTVYVALRWRVLVCLVTSLFIAVKLSALPWVSAPQLILFVGLGMALGLAWDEYLGPTKAAESPPPSEPTTLSTLVAAVLIASAAWGAVSSSGLGSALFGAGIAAVAVASWYVVHRQRSGAAQPHRPLILAAASAIGYVFGIFVVQNAG